MVIDHTNIIWFEGRFLWMSLLGRTTFPLFCYAVTVAVMKKDANGVLSYVTRLLLLAALVQPFYQIALGKQEGNIIFTLAAGAAFAALAAFNPKVRPWHMYVLYVAAILSEFQLNAIEFGLSGIMLPSAMVLALRGQSGAYPFMLLLLFSLNASGWGAAFQGEVGPEAWMIAFWAGLASTLPPLLLLFIAKGMKQTGRYLSKYSLHVFYPGHMMALKLAGLLFF